MYELTKVMSFMTISRTYVKHGRFFGTKTTNLLSSLQNISSPSSSLRYKIRNSKPIQKGLQKNNNVSKVNDINKRDVVAYCTANSYNLFDLNTRILEQGLYEVVPLSDDLVSTCLCVTTSDRYKNRQNGEENRESNQKDIYFFGEGSVVFWNVPELERENVLRFLKGAEFDESYDDETVHNEAEMLHFSVESSSNTDVNSAKRTHLRSGGHVALVENSNLKLEKYSFSNAIAASVKLGVLESNLDAIIDSIEHISEDMKRGKSIKMSREQVLKKTGEIFALRHVVNLASDLLDTPDFYWDREYLESLYHVTCSHLSIAKRTRLLNEKLSHCAELLELITGHLNDEHHVRLEWFIIILIMIEVAFEILHFAEKFL